MNCVRYSLALLSMAAFVSCGGEPEFKLEPLELPEFISIDGNNVSPDAEMVDLTGRNIHDISGISALKKVEWLRLGANPIRDISELGKLKTLKKLELVALNPLDWTPIGNLHNLERLTINHSAPIRDPSFLVQLTKLKDLDLFCTPIYGLNITELNELTWLNVAYTGIVTFDGFPKSARVTVVLTPGVSQARLNTYKEFNTRAKLGFNIVEKCDDWRPVYAPNADPE